MTTTVLSPPYCCRVILVTKLAALRRFNASRAIDTNPRSFGHRTDGSARDARAPRARLGTLLRGGALPTTHGADRHDGSRQSSPTLPTHMPRPRQNSGFS